MRRVVVIFFCLLGYVFAQAQNVRNVTFERVGNTIEISYQLKHLPLDRCAWVEIFYSTDNGKIWQGPIKCVSGDIGKVVYGGNKKVTWDVFSELEKINGILLFEVRATIDKKDFERENIVLYNISETAPIGFMYARVKRWGGFLRLKMDTGFHVGYDYECDRDGNIASDFVDMYYKVEKGERKARAGITGGVLYRINTFFYVYAGAGYGCRQVQWKAALYNYFDDKKVRDMWLQDKRDSFSGIEMDGGIIFRYRNFCMSAGISGIVGGFKEVSGGVGIIL